MDDVTVRRLIEVDLPIGVISQHARHDQNVKKGHLHTLHVWWATRPLAACRAVLMATLLPDPVDERCPESFRKEASELLVSFSRRDLSDPVALRHALLDFIGHFASWDNSNKPAFVETARRLVKAAHPDGTPLVVDPFAGIGSIPFETLRIGADAFAGDLNPVAILLNKTALEYLPTYGYRLAETVRKWGQWVRERAAEELVEFYPPEPDDSIPLAYLWARTIRCEGPACGAEVPLVGLLWLSRKAKQMVALRYRGDKTQKHVLFEIIEPQSERELQPSIVRKFAVTCPVCGYTTPYKQVREQIRAREGGTRDARMIAVITLKPGGGRSLRLATDEDVAVARRAAVVLGRRQAEYKGFLPLVPDESAPEARGSGASRAFSIRKWGMETWGDLFTPRQALALTTFVKLVREAHQQMLKETGDVPFARAVSTCLALAVSNMSPYLTALSIGLKEIMDLRSVFWGSALPIHSDFVESNPLRPQLLGGIEYALNLVVQVLERESSQGLKSGTVQQSSAAAIPLPDQSVSYVVTDPPYYDAVPYAALSDFCYVWLKRMVGHLHPDLFRWSLTPKAEECILDPGPPPSGEQEKNKAFFEDTMERALTECRRVLQPGGLAVVLFAHKGTAGWEALLNALVRAGWTVTASWPIETERGARMRAKDSAVLASSVFLVCRPRSANASVGEWRQVLTGLSQKVSEWLPRLAQEGIQGADAIFSCLGPALEVYSQYNRVETAGGQVIPLGDVRNSRGEIVQRGYLSYIWEAVAREALKDFPTDEMDARVTGFWLWTIRSRIIGQVAAGETEEVMLEDEELPGRGKPLGGYALPYDDARLIIQGLVAQEDQLKRPGGVLEVQGNTARLLSVAERRRFLIGKEDSTYRTRQRDHGEQLVLEEIVPYQEDMVVAPGQSTLDRLHQAMLLFADGRNEALRRLLLDEGVGRDERFWRLANSLSALYPPSSQDKRWVDGVIGRRKGLGL